MKDGPAPHSYRPVVGRLQLLSTYKKDWPLLNWSHEFKVLIAASARSGISGGFLHQIHPDGQQCTLELGELPSCRTARPPAMTRHLKFNAPEIENIVVDRSQSLIIASHVFSVQNGRGVVLYFRDLWTFGKHPRACGSWLEDNDIQFISENRLLVVRRVRGLPVLSIYNISDIGAVAIERDYELPEAWNRSIFGFSPNTSPLTDQSSSEAMFYPDPSKRILILAVKTPSLAGAPSVRNWLIINESYFRPTSRKDRLRVSWHEWSQACLIRDVHSSVRGPCVNGNRVVYVENAPRSSSRSGGGTALSRLNVIEFAPYPESESHQSRAWSLVGPRSVLVPNEATREIPSKSVDGRPIEDLRVTEDNIVLFLCLQENPDASKPVNILTFGAPPQTRSRH
ncbi:hypothetical protein DXG03_007789 [Asterophora parasitica]|uniref:Uncharacterized protein n=1 Tax=Asterophora parasitica TaxID=117018 RepID=A0A9P7KGJ8_9AGAR|nr:hypothetical protein DXG03_007789 [Asterophora parasitica]